MQASHCSVPQGIESLMSVWRGKRVGRTGRGSVRPIAASGMQASHYSVPQGIESLMSVWRGKRVGRTGRGSVRPIAASGMQASHYSVPQGIESLMSFWGRERVGRTGHGRVRPKASASARDRKQVPHGLQFLCFSPRRSSGFLSLAGRFPCEACIPDAASRTAYSFFVSLPDAHPCYPLRDASS
jgi:hypothetical protein